MRLNDKTSPERPQRNFSEKGRHPLAIRRPGVFVSICHKKVAKFSLICHKYVP